MGSKNRNGGDKLDDGGYISRMDMPFTEYVKPEKLSNVTDGAMN